MSEYDCVFCISDKYKVNCPRCQYIMKQIGAGTLSNGICDHCRQARSRFRNYVGDMKRFIYSKLKSTLRENTKDSHKLQKSIKILLRDVEEPKHTGLGLSLSDISIYRRLQNRQGGKLIHSKVEFDHTNTFFLSRKSRNKALSAEKTVEKKDEVDIKKATQIISERQFDNIFLDKRYVDRFKVKETSERKPFELVAKMPREQNKFTTEKGNVGKLKHRQERQPLLTHFPVDSSFKSRSETSEDFKYLYSRAVKTQLSKNKTLSATELYRHTQDQFQMQGKRKKNLGEMKNIIDEKDNKRQARKAQVKMKFIKKETLQKERTSLKDLSNMSNIPIPLNSFRDKRQLRKETNLRKLNSQSSKFDESLRQDRKNRKKNVDSEEEHIYTNKGAIRRGDTEGGLRKSEERPVTKRRKKGEDSLAVFENQVDRKNQGTNGVEVKRFKQHESKGKTKSGKSGIEYYNFDNHVDKETQKKKKRDNEESSKGNGEIKETEGNGRKKSNDIGKKKERINLTKEEKTNKEKKRSKTNYKEGISDKSSKGRPIIEEENERNEREVKHERNTDSRGILLSEDGKTRKIRLDKNIKKGEGVDRDHSPGKEIAQKLSKKRKEKLSKEKEKSEYEKMLLIPGQKKKEKNDIERDKIESIDGEGGKDKENKNRAQKLKKATKENRDKENVLLAFEKRVLAPKKESKEIRTEELSKLKLKNMTPVLRKASRSPGKRTPLPKKQSREKEDPLPGTESPLLGKGLLSFKNILPLPEKTLVVNENRETGELRLEKSKFLKASKAKAGTDESDKIVKVIPDKTAYKGQQDTEKRLHKKAGLIREPSSKSNSKNKLQPPKQYNDEKNIIRVKKFVGSSGKMGETKESALKVLLSSKNRRKREGTKTDFDEEDKAKIDMKSIKVTQPNNNGAGEHRNKSSETPVAIFLQPPKGLKRDLNTDVIHGSLTSKSHLELDIPKAQNKGGETADENDEFIYTDKIIKKHERSEHGVKNNQHRSTSKNALFEIKYAVETTNENPHNGRANKSSTQVSTHYSYMFTEIYCELNAICASFIKIYLK